MTKQHTLTIPANLIRALLEACPKKDARENLMGISIVPRGDADSIALQATDGHIGTITLAHGQSLPDDVPAFTVPRDLFDKIKPKSGFVTVTTPGEDGAVVVEYAGVTVTGCVPDGPVPPLARLIPAEPSGEVAQFNPDLLVRLKKAAALISGVKAQDIHVAHNGANPALVTAGDLPDFVAVAMPLRLDAPPARPEWIEDICGRI